MKTLASLDEEVTSAFGRQVDVQVRRRGERRSGKETHIRWNHGTIVVSLPNGLEGRVSGTDVSHDAVLTPHNPAAYDKGSRVSEGIRHPESDWSSDVQTWFDQASCGRMDRFTATSRLKYT